MRTDIGLSTFNSGNQLSVPAFSDKVYLSELVLIQVEHNRVVGLAKTLTPLNATK